jgi:hypothetical protein
MLQTDTITYYLEINGTTTTTAIYKPCTILATQIQQERTSSNTIIKDGTIILNKNYSLSTPYIEVNHICQNNIIVEKIGNDNAFITLNYLPYERATTTPKKYGFTNGEILISFFLFIIILGSVFGFIINKFLTDKQK